MSVTSKIIEVVRKIFSDSEKGAHTLDHIMRVHSLSIQLSEGENVNTKVLEAAALLHDIGRPKEEVTGISHSILSGEMSREILEELHFTADEVERVIEAIRTHRFSEGIEPTSLEGQILSDADKLDAIGAIGIYRAVAQAASSGRGIEGFLKHADEKLLKLHGLMYTAKAGFLAEDRHGFLKSFVNRLREETRSAL